MRLLRLIAGCMADAVGSARVSIKRRLEGERLQRPLEASTEFVVALSSSSSVTAVSLDGRHTTALPVSLFPFHEEGPNSAPPPGTRITLTIRVNREDVDEDEDARDGLGRSVCNVQERLSAALDC